MNDNVLRLVPYAFGLGILAWLVWWMLFRKRPQTDSTVGQWKWWHLFWLPSFFQHMDGKTLGTGKPKVRRERLLFVAFLVIGLLAFFFDPFPKAR